MLAVLRRGDGIPTLFGSLILQKVLSTVHQIDRVWPFPFRVELKEFEKQKFQSCRPILHDVQEL